MKTQNITTATRLNKRERKAQQLLTHYATCEKLALACGMPASKVDGRKISRALARVEHTAHLLAEAACNGDTIRVYGYGVSKHSIEEFEFRQNGERSTARLITCAEDAVRNILGSVPPGFFVNTGPRGYALKIDGEKAEGRALIDAIAMHRDWGNDGILSPEISGN